MVLEKAADEPWLVFCARVWTAVREQTGQSPVDFWGRARKSTGSRRERGKVGCDIDTLVRELHDRGARLRVVVEVAGAGTGAGHASYVQPGCTVSNRERAGCKGE
jgi:hypothetical protein